MLCLGGTEKEYTIGVSLHNLVKALVFVKVEFIPIIKPGAAHLFFAYVKTEGMNKVQRHIGNGTRPRYIAGICRDFGFDQYNVKLHNI